MDREGYLLSASTPGEDTFSMSEGGKKDVSFGLVPGHAYSLIALKQLSNGAQIVCVCSVILLSPLPLSWPLVP
jgi:hypothetical protein